MKITKLQIFDFDDTLFRVPSYTSKTQVEAMGYGFGGPYEYYDHPISLDENISNIQLIGPVYSEWIKGKDDPSCMQILITHRVESMQGTVNSILRNRNMDFDRSFFLGRVTPKIEMTGRVMKELPMLEEVEVFEDSVDQIIQYQTFFQQIKADRALKVKIQIVDKSTMYVIEDLKLSEKRRITLI